MIALHFRTGQTSAQQNLQTLLGEDFERFLGDLLIGSRQELFHGFDNGHFRAEARPDRTQLEADHAGTDDAELARNALKVQCAGGVDDDVLIDRRRRNVYRSRAGGKDDVLGSQGLHVAVQAGHFNLLAGQQLAVAFEYGHTVGLQQSRNPTGKVLNDLVLARDHGRNVNGHFASADAMNLEALVGFMKLVGAVQQRLGRNATYVQARAAQSGLTILALVFFDTCGLQTQLGCTNGGHIAARAGTDDDDVEFLAHYESS